MNAPSGRQTSPSDWLERSRSFAPLAATVFGLLYAAGFVVVNAYLASYGIRELEAVRTRYVGAGIVFLAFVAVPVLGSTFVWQRFLARTPRPLAVLILLVAGPALLSALESTLIWRANAGPFGDQGIPDAFGPRFVAPVLLANLFLVGFASAWRVLRAASRSVYAMPARGFFGWLTAFALAGVTLGYANYVYPAIPGYLGGGVPSRVRLVVSQQVADACPACVREDVLLIDEDAHRWVVLARDANGKDIAVEIFLLPNGDRAIIHVR